MVKSKYAIFKNDDFKKSKILKDALNIAENDACVIDDWFWLFLEKHAQKVYKISKVCNNVGKN